MESAWSPIVLLGGAVVRLLEKWVKKRIRYMKCGQSELTPENMLLLTPELIVMAKCTLLSFTVIETSHYRVTLFQKGKVISKGGKTTTTNPSRPSMIQPLIEDVYHITILFFKSQTLS